MIVILNVREGSRMVYRGGPNYGQDDNPFLEVL